MADLNRALAQYNQQVEAQNEKLTAQYAKMKAMSILIESLYRKVADQNALLEQRVSERTENLQATIKQLQDIEPSIDTTRSRQFASTALLQGLIYLGILRYGRFTGPIIISAATCIISDRAATGC